jgi:hypothetical protein
MTEAMSTQMKNARVSEVVKMIVTRELSTEACCVQPFGITLVSRPPAVGVADEEAIEGCAIASIGLAVGSSQFCC